MAHDRSLGNFDKGYQRRSFRSGLVRAFIYGGLVSLLIMFLLPFTQMLSSIGRQEQDIRSFDVVQPPPPPPPEVEEPPEEPPPEQAPPEMAEPPPPMNLAQLELALNPGIGDAAAAVTGFGGFDVAPDAAADLQLFDVRDLDELPRPIGSPRMATPLQARRERISGSYRVEVRIDEQGRTHVLNVLSAEPARFTQDAIAFVETIRWTPPKKNGETVSARYVFPVGWSL